MLGTTYYHASIRKLTVGFGNMFNNISIERRTGMGSDGTVVRRIKVPLAYGNKQHYLAYVAQKQERRQGGKVNIRMQLPRMAFRMQRLQYDPSRKLITVNRNSVNSIDADDRRIFQSQYQPVPYNFFFTLDIMAKNYDDGLQIIEQIVPYFTPELSMTIDEIPQLGIQHDVPVELQNIDPSENYIGEMATELMLTWTLTFIVRGYIYPPVTDSGLIERVFANIYSDAAMETLTETLETFVDDEKIESGDVDINDRDSIIAGAETLITAATD